MIQEDYVSFETAKLLEEKGFDIYCPTAYETMTSEHRVEETAFSDWGKLGQVKRPSLSLATKWIREVYNILLIVDYNYECTSKSYCYKIYHLGKNGKPKKIFPVYGVSYDDEGNENKDIIYYRDFQLSDSEYTTYEEALESAIYYCLEYLI